MRKKYLFTILLLLPLVKLGYGQEVDSPQNNFQFGVLGGVNQIRAINSDVLGGTKIIVLSKSVEANLGYSYFQNLTNYNAVKDILYFSHGVFAEGNYFFNSIFYAGLRLNLNMNWVERDSQKKFDAVSGVNSPTFFTGRATFVQLGMHHNIAKNISLRIQGQLGIHNFKIAQDAVYFNNSSDRFRNAQFGIEHRSDFLYNLCGGLFLKI
jgi:hypothetical protein